MQDEAGDTSLHLAASKGHVPAVFHVFNSEAAKDVTRWSLRNKRGWTAGELGALPDSLPSSGSQTVPSLFICELCACEHHPLGPA